MKVQRVKVQYGVDGSATDVSDSNPLPIDDAGGSVTVDNGGTFAVQVDGAALTALQLIDNYVFADDAAFTLASSSVAVAGAIRDDALSTLTAIEGDAVPLRVSSTGALHVAVSEGGVAGKAEDAAHITGDEGIVLLAVRRDSAAVGSGTDGDYSTVNVDSTGRLWCNVANTVTVASHAVTNAGTFAVQVDAAIPAGTNNIGDVDIASIAAGDNNIGNVDIVTMPNVTLAAGTNTNEVVGDAAHDAAVAGNPVRIAGRALTASYTAVATGDTADLITTTIGQLVEIPYSIPENTWSYAAASGGITNTTGVTAKAAGAAGIRNYITRAQIVNGHATVSTDVQIRDGASGTVLWRGFAQAAGGGVSAVFDPPLRGTAATLVEVACGTTGSATYFNLQGYVAP